jgi:hypothetical protein
LRKNENEKEKEKTELEEIAQAKPKLNLVDDLCIATNILLKKKNMSFDIKNLIKKKTTQRNEVRD